MDLTPPRKVHEHPYENASYKHFFGHDPMEELVQSDPFKGVPPTDPRDYRIYRSHYEDGYYKMMLGLPIDDKDTILDPETGLPIRIKVSGSCEWMDEHDNPVALRKCKKDHLGNDMMWACPHVIFADPVNPEGVVCIPFQKDLLFCYFLCKTCFKLMQNCRLRYDQALSPKCGVCMKEAIDKLKLRHPDRFKDLRFDGVLPYQL